MDALKPLGIEPVLLIAYAVNFLVLLALLRVFLYKPVLNMMAQRRQKIQDGLQEAEKVRQQAAVERQEFEKELEESRRVSQESAARAAQTTEKMREEILSQAQAEAEQIKARALQEIDVERKQAEAELRRYVADLTVELAGKVLGETVARDEDTQRRLIDKFLTEMGDLS